MISTWAGVRVSVRPSREVGDGHGTCAGVPGVCVWFLGVLRFTGPVPPGVGVYGGDVCAGEGCVGSGSSGGGFFGGFKMSRCCLLISRLP